MNGKNRITTQRKIETLSTDPEIQCFFKKINFNFKIYGRKEGGCRDGIGGFHINN